MDSKINHSPINWKNGMPFYADHLNRQYLAVADETRDAVALHLTGFNFGLIGGDGQKKFSDSFHDNINNEKVEIAYCRAITQNGSRIEIINSNWEELNQPLSKLIGQKNLNTSTYWYVLLVVDLFHRVPDGIEDEHESPRRKPNTRPTYHIELMSLKDLRLDALANAIPLAKYENTSSGLKKITDYIPPCTRINSHELLIQKYEEYKSYLFDIKDYSMGIIKKIKHKRLNGELNQLAESIDALCKKFLDHLILSYDEYNLTLKDQPPIKLVEFFARFARVLNHSIDMTDNSDHVLQYFQQYTTDISVGQLNKIISDTYESNYVHYDISDSLINIDNFLGTIHHIFRRLEELDYMELAPRNVVKSINYTVPIKDDARGRPVRPSFKIKHSGKEKLLGGDLE